MDMCVFTTAEHEGLSRRAVTPLDSHTKGLQKSRQRMSCTYSSACKQTAVLEGS